MNWQGSARRRITGSKKSQERRRAYFRRATNPLAQMPMNAPSPVVRTVGEAGARIF